jgi:uncharacterized protein YukE
MDTRVIAHKAAPQLLEHRNRLAGKADDAHRAFEALDATAKTVTEHRDDHKTSATSHWDGQNATAFDRRAGKLTAALDTTASSAARAATIVGSAADALNGGHRAVAQLVDEYTTKASQTLDAGLAVKGAGGQAALIRAVGQVVDLVRGYTGESAKHYAGVQQQLRDSVTQLKALEHTVDHDGVVDPTHTTHKPRPKANHRPAPKPTKPHGHGHPATHSGTADKIKTVARSQLGYHEGPGNQNKYGPAESWCALFATWVWRKSGVDIPSLAFTGAVYDWGRAHHLAYDAHHLNQARPGDVLLFGSGPQNTSTSTHIGIVESVHGNQVTLIEGNSSDRVQRVTHTLSSSTFYGGVHPR